MTSSKLIKEVLANMPETATPIYDLCTLMDRQESNLRRILNEMEDLGLVVNEPINVQGRKFHKRTRGWRKTRLI
jgi:predicted transcriptional regulator